MEPMTLEENPAEVQRQFAIVRDCLTQALALDEAEAAQLGLHTSAAEVRKWDSLAHLMLILELEQQFGIEFDDDETAALHSVDAILRAVMSKEQ